MFDFLSRKLLVITATAGLSIAGAAVILGDRPAGAPPVESVALQGAARAKGSAVAAGKPGSSDAKTFRIDGSASGLFPGAVRPVPLVLTNPNSFPINVTELSVTVASSSAGCEAAAHLDGSSWHGSAVVAKKGSLTLASALTITMKPSAPQACEGLGFTLTFAGKADKA